MFSPEGTVATISDEVQLEIDAVTEPNCTVPWDEPKFVPSMVTLDPIGPLVGLNDVIETVVDDDTVNCVEDVPVNPLTVTVINTGPEIPGGTCASISVSLQYVADDDIPPKETVLDP